MSLSRLRKRFCSQLCIGSLAATLAMPAMLYAEITFQREIVALDNPLLPQWKLHWDMGRDAVRKGDLEGGARFYQMVLRDKPQIEEASWEYSQLLVQLKKFQEATTLLENLIELNPNRSDYLILAGQAALANKEYNRAVRYLSQAYSLQPAGEQGIKVLRGLIDGLNGLDRKENAFGMMEQLRERTPADQELLLDLARMAHQLGYDEKAREYYSALIDGDGSNRAALDEAARIFAATGQEEKAAPLWKKLLQNDPENDEYHRQLLSHYRKTEASGEALPHLLALVDGKDTANQALLLETARIYLKDQGRADKALPYYERYLQLNPHDQAVSAELDTACRQVGDQLLAIVENDGAMPLWKDLAHITTHRLEIFLVMAEKLEKKGQKDSLIQILEIIYQQPGYNSEELAVRLKDLYLATGRPESAYMLFENITSAQYLTYQFYKDKGELELQLGYDLAALATLNRALNIRPESDELRLACLELAGQLGDAETMDRLARPLFSHGLQQNRFPLYQMYLHGLRQNGRYDDAKALSDTLLDESWLSDATRNTLHLDLARDMREMDRMFEAERLLRTLVAEGHDNDPGVMAELIESALLSGSTQDAKTLFMHYTGKDESSGWKVGYTNDQRAFFLAYIHLLEKEGQRNAAQKELATFLTDFRKVTADHPNDHRGTLLHLELELCRLYLINGEKQGCLDLVRLYEKSGKLPPEMRLVKYIAAGNGTVNPEALITNIPGRENNKGGVTELFRLAETAVMLDKENAALSFIQEIERLYPPSVRAEVASAKLLKNTGKLELAEKAFNTLHQQNPDEFWFYVQYLQLRFRQGDHDTVLAELNRHPFPAMPFELKLLQARALYAAKRQGESFQVYESLLHPSARSIYRDEMAAQGIHVSWQDEEEQTFWKMFGYDEPDWFDHLNRLQGNDGFLAKARTPAGVTAARLYDSYRRERMVGSEFLARKALEDNKYTVAEKQYQKNAEQGQSTEGLKDLARIYERLGEYGKQAEVYSSLEKRGEVAAPELQESIERNKVALAPTLGFNFEYVEKNGRDDLINLQKISAGTGFQYLPSLNSKLQFGITELFFDPAEGSGPSVDGRLLSVSGGYKFNELTSIELASGLQILDSDSDSSATYSARIERKFDPLLSGYLEINQKLIDDTVEAIDMGFITNSILGGLVLEGTKGFTLGGEFERLWYEDDNAQNRLFFFGSYSIFDRLTTYEMKYSYELLNNKDDDTAVAGDGEAVVESVLPYWSPDEYWQHLIAIKYHHLLNNPEEAERPPGSYSFDLSVGYESELDFTIGGGADIFLEIGSNFLVKGRLSYIEGSDYREESATLSLMYRW